MRKVWKPAKAVLTKDFGPFVETVLMKKVKFVTVELCQLVLNNAVLHSARRQEHLVHYKTKLTNAVQVEVRENKI